MNLSQSLALSELQRQGQPVAQRRYKTVEQICAMTDGQVREDLFASEEFVLLDVALHHASMPYTYRNDNAVQAAMHAAADTDGGVVLDLNTKKIGKTANGYAPPVIVLYGQAVVQAARLAGRETIRTWIGKLAAQKLNLIHADHQLSSTELNSKIQQAHNERAGVVDSSDGIASPTPYNQRPHVGEVYPMENYHIFNQNGQDYKQKHYVDMPSRTVKLVGKPQPVKQKYVAMNAAFKREGHIGHVKHISHNTRPAHKGFASPMKHRSFGHGHEAFPSMPKIKFSGLQISEAAQLQGFGGGGASGPPYDSGLGTQPAAERTSMKSAKKKKRMKGFAGTEMTDDALQKHRGASNSEMRKRFEQGGAKPRHSGMEGSGYYGYPGASKAFDRKKYGASNSEMSPQLQAAITEFEAAMDAGEEVPDMKNVAPPGMEDTVMQLKRHFGEKSSSPFKIAWYIHNKKKKG